MNKIASVNKGSKSSKRKALQKPDAFREFVLWMSVFEALRNPPTQQDFSKKYKVSEHTLSTWKKRDDFWEAVEVEWKAWGKEKTTNIMNKFYTTIMQQGESANFKLWFQYFLNWQEKQQMRIDSEDIKKLTEQISKITESWKKDDHTRDHESDGGGPAADGGGKVVSS